MRSGRSTAGDSVPEDLDIWMSAARAENDRDAFARVVEACHHLLRASVLRETADPDLADEIAQDAFVRAWERRGQYRPGTSPRAWLLTIARSQLIAYQRCMGRDRRHVKELVRQELLRNAPVDDEGPRMSQRLEALRSCLVGIPTGQRELLDLVHGKGLTTEAAADQLGIEAPTCRQRLSRLQRALRKCAEIRMQRQA
jgi:RNA polymerase sigma-70 factor (ECF subfamily)